VRIHCLHHLKDKTSALPCLLLKSRRQSSPLKTSCTSSRTKFINASYPFNVPVTMSPQKSAHNRKYPTKAPSQMPWELQAEKRMTHTFSPPIKLHRYALVHILPQIQNILLLRPLPALRMLCSMPSPTTTASVAPASSAASVFGVPSTAAAPAASRGVLAAFGHRGRCCAIGSVESFVQCGVELELNIPVGNLSARSGLASAKAECWRR
jgi:hypothetical protein